MLDLVGFNYCRSEWERGRFDGLQRGALVWPREDRADMENHD